MDPRLASMEPSADQTELVVLPGFCTQLPSWLLLVADRRKGIAVLGSRNSLKHNRISWKVFPGQIFTWAESVLARFSRWSASGSTRHS